MILARFRRDNSARTINALYGAIVAQSRACVFYREYGVPDTVDGRFDLLVLHLVLLLRRLARNGEAGRAIGQQVFDAFCRDLDANLREMGIGDFVVPKRMRRFAEAFYGRQEAYLDALAAGDRQAFEEALARNIFQGGAAAGAVRLASYAHAALDAFDAQDDEALIRGEVAFPSPEAIADARG